MHQPDVKKKIAVLIPCYNEEQGIASVIRKFPKERLAAFGYELEVIVIDNNSKDRTAEIARENGATVLSEDKKGKGNAIRHGFEYVAQNDADYVVMLDGDDTYRPEEVLRLVEPLDSGFCSVVIGSRLAGRISEGSMGAVNRIGNWIFSHLVRYFYGANVTDVLTGYFAWKRESLLRLAPHLKSTDFSIEMEMVTKMARLGEEIYCVPISYDARAGESNLNPLTDGARIMSMFLRVLVWEPEKPDVRTLAFVSDAVMPFHQGGKEKRLYEIARRMVSDDCEVRIYTMQWWEGPKIKVVDGIRYHALCGHRPMYVNGRRSILQALCFGLASLKLAFAKFDVIDVDHMPFFPLLGARLATWVRGKKLHATWHEVWGRAYWKHYLGGVSGLLGHAVESLSMRLPDVIISNSEHTTRRLRLENVRCEIVTVPLGADLESITAAVPAAEGSDAIYVGRLIDHKNVDLLIRATATVKMIHPQFRTAIVGVGPERQKLQALVAELGLEENVTFYGAIEGAEDVYAKMKASKMLVLPSVREGFGLVVVEANAADIPVITTEHENNAAKELISEGVNGFLVTPDVDALASKMLQVLATRDDLRPRQDIERYDWQKVAGSLQRVFG